MAHGQLLMRRVWAALNRNGGRELLVDTLVYTIAKGVPGLLGLASVVVFLRLAGAEAYGLYALLGAIVSVWATFSAGWFYQGVLRFGDTWSADRQMFRRTVVTGTIFASIIFCTCCVLHFLFAGYSRSLGLLLTSLCLGSLIVAQTILLSALQTTLQPKRILLTELIRSIACFGGAVVLLYIIPNRVVGLLAGTALGYALSFLGASPHGIWLQAITRESKPAVVAQMAKAWHFGWPLSLWFAAQLLIPLIDRTMIASQLGLQVTGRFSALSDILTRCFSLAIFPITQAVYPRLARLVNEHKTVAAKSLLRRAGLLLLFAGVIILPIIYFFRHFIVRFALPSNGDSYASLVLPLAMGGFVWQAALLAHKPLELGNRTPLMLLAMVVAIVLKGAGNYWALPLWGPLGAALATLVAGTGYCLLCMLLDRTATPLR